MRFLRITFVDLTFSFLKFFAVLPCSAAEIDFGGSTNGRTANTSTDKIIVVTTDIQGPLDKTKYVDSSVKEINQSDVKTRLQHLEVELSSVLHSLRSNSPDLSDKVRK